MLKLKSMMELKDADSDEKVEQPAPIQREQKQGGDADKSSLHRGNASSVDKSLHQAEKWTGDEPSIKCRIPVKDYPSFKRRVHPAVCELHREMKDLRCLKFKCPRVKL